MKSRKENLLPLLVQAGVDGIIASSPENFHYVTGFAGHQHTVSRQPGFSAAVLSCQTPDPVYALTMDFEAPAFLERDSGCIILPYDTWVGVRTQQQMESGQCPPPGPMRTSLDVLVQAVEELGLQNKTLGLEMQYLPTPYLESLREKLPDARFVNISDCFVQARSVKTLEEIQMFRELCHTADLAFSQVAAMATVGVSEKEMAQCFRTAVIQSGFCAPSAWSMFSTGPNGARLGLPTERRVQEGDVVKFDAGVNAEFDFYTTDTSRSWVIGQADPLLLRLKDRLYQAQRKMIEAAKPGLPICQLFQLGFDYVQKEFPAYRRGHLGHSISMGPATAEAPFINSTETRLLEPGMILAMEVPCYIDGVGGFNIEDMVLITPTGSEVLTPLTPHYLPHQP